MIERLTYRGGDAEVAPRLARILQRHAGIPADVEARVRRILEAVRDRGDEAVLEFGREFDNADLTPESLRVPAAALAAADRALDPDLQDALEEAADNIRAFHERQRTNSWFVEDGDGVILGKKVTPIRRVGICVPGGQAPLISSLLMAAIPAQVAGVPEICAVAPPGVDGLPHALILAAAELLGIDEVYAVGGAQAVAALAYGTATIPAVDKIVGPGGPYTVAAKQLVFGRVGIEMIPGPSEIAVLADEGADPRYIAADLLSQAEHGSGYEAALCITPSPALAAEVQAEVEAQLRRLPRAEAAARALEAYGAVVEVPDLVTGIELVNRIAPEHVELLVDEPWTWLGDIDNAGAIFLGPASTEPVGD
ncbi:MAG: histidinol dehydrogenase, partial [Gemmatimonadota bacterium]